MPKDAVETLENTLLYSRKNVKLPTNQDRRLHNSNTAANRTDSNLTEKITKFADMINEQIVNRIPLRFLTDIVLVNRPIISTLKLSVLSRQT